MELDRIIGANVASKSFSTDLGTCNLHAGRKIYVSGYNKGGVEV